MENETVNYAESYSKALAQEFPYVLNFGALFNTPNNSIYKVVDAKTIKIPVISTTGRVDADRDSIGEFNRNVNNAWETKTLTNERSWRTLLHPADVDQTNMVLSIQNATKVFNEEQKFPEMDAYCVSKIFADVEELNESLIDTTELTTENILEQFDKYMEHMDEKRVPQTGRILYVTPATKTLLKNAKDIVRNLTVEGGNSKVLQRAISRIDEVEVETVPSDLMKTAYNFTTGWAPAASAKQINMLLIHPQAVYTPVSYSFSGMQAPSASTAGKYLYYEESFEDTFILNNKVNAIMFNVTENEVSL